ncbi:MAG TPA: flagellar hook capping FlgD N-terminal domain-containing protein [Acidimicrobiia bacterium]
MIDGVAAAAPYTTNPTPNQTAASALGGLGSDAFLKLLVAQLRYQNPLQPTDPSSMLGQTAQFTTVETLQTLADLQRELMGFHEAVGAMSMIGRHVTAVGFDGDPVAGIVEKVRFAPEGVLLTVDGVEIPLASVMEASAGPADTTADTAPTPEPGDGASAGTDPVEGPAEPTETADGPAESDPGDPGSPPVS